MGKKKKSKKDKGQRKKDKKRVPNQKPQKSNPCVGRESNPGPVDGNDRFYH